MKKICLEESHHNLCKFSKNLKIVATITRIKSKPIIKNKTIMIKIRILKTKRRNIIKSVIERRMNKKKKQTSQYQDQSIAKSFNNLNKQNQKNQNMFKKAIP
jgi:hypothetical protein